MKTITIKAWAKINLTLDVLGKRPDGYHELSSVMQAISLYDAVTIEVLTQDGITLTTNHPDLPADERNLAFRAAQLLTNKGISVNLQKNIPLAAGLAGGSSDAAAVLLGLNELLGRDMPQEKLLELGRQLGADVPFCVLSGQAGASGTALAEGIGERLTPLDKHPEVSIVLARLPISVSTEKIFAAWSSGRSENQTSTMVRAIATGNVKKIAENLANDLMPIATAMYPEILELIAAFREHEALGVNMTGSGPTIFAYFAEQNTALSAIKDMRQRFPTCELYFAQPKP